ncbi:hypothetical protein HG531_001702 [Fusarium graminearum]|nr:hypothetical protein HG531_001702 [Fusarium graminearum]
MFFIDAAHLGDLGCLDIGWLLVQYADQSRSSKRQTHTSSGGVNLVVGLTGINPRHLHAAAAEIQEQSATFNTSETASRTHDSTKQGFHSGFQDAHFETVGHRSDCIEHLGRIVGAAHGLCGEDGNVPCRYSMPHGKLMETL